jgi:hypothetical protein
VSAFGKDLADPVMAGGAALSGSGHAPNFLNGAQLKPGHGLNEHFPGDAEAMANVLSWAAFTTFVRAGVVHESFRGSSSGG